ncbi:type II toxin-antitoxin system HicB family antitoxin [Anaerovibrio sp.]|uniref:type II toxin-antitoxin system HicB family antitoxin n=1 Tax=Anaerovibrio sp. TaxID=1872532 RepID=UPI002621D82B|nr:type II toxin-antitoxin system HicB family antitoxin [Anaerovibrio sp.]MDD6598359.1 type II toxin-antitoxin system HicB family antitoxin [Anaerovibrio sp.]
MKDFYTYPALFHVADDGISITFPDLPGCLPCADNMEEAFCNAREALQLHLYGMEEDNELIPGPSPVSAIHPEANETIAMIEAWMPPFRERMANKAVNKTVTIPRWLDTLAKRENVNFSHIFQQSLKDYLGVADNPSKHILA